MKHMGIVAAMPLDPPCPFTCPDGAFLHEDECPISKAVRQWDRLDDVCLRVFNGAFVRRVSVAERAALAPRVPGPWVLVDAHPRYGISIAHYVFEDER
jgi:hypothetical protein